jgi:hypothetical protein
MLFAVLNSTGSVDFTFWNRLFTSFSVSSMASLAFRATTGKMLIAYPAPFGCALIIPALVISAFQSFAKVTVNCGSSFGNRRVFPSAMIGRQTARARTSARVLNFIAPR